MRFRYSRKSNDVGDPGHATEQPVVFTISLLMPWGKNKKKIFPNSYTQTKLQMFLVKDPDCSIQTLQSLWMN